MPVQFYDNGSDPPDWAEGGEIVEIEPPLKDNFAGPDEASNVGNSQSDSPKAGYGTPLQGRSGRKGEGPIQGRNPIKKEPEPLKEFARKNLEDQGNAAGDGQAFNQEFQMPIITMSVEEAPPTLDKGPPGGRDFGRRERDDTGGEAYIPPWHTRLTGDETASVGAGKIMGYYIENDGNPDNPEELPKYVQIKTVAKFDGGDIATVVEGFIFGRVAIEELVGLGETPYYYFLTTAAGDEFTIQDRFANAAGTITVDCAATLPKSTSTEWIFEIAEVIDTDGVLSISPSLTTNPIINLQAKTIVVGP